MAAGGAALVRGTPFTPDQTATEATPQNSTLEEHSPEPYTNTDQGMVRSFLFI